MRVRIHVILSLSVVTWGTREGVNDECKTLNVKRERLQASASGGGIGAGNAFTALAIRVRQIDLGKLPRSI